MEGNLDLVVHGSLDQDPSCSHTVAGTKIRTRDHKYLSKSFDDDTQKWVAFEDKAF